MSDSRKLKKHLLGIRATEKLASAMKTVATAKFSTLSALNSAYAEYSDACADMMKGFGASKLRPEGKGTLYLLFTGNRGLCGGYNSETVAYIEENAEKDSTFIVCGKKGEELLAAKGIAAEHFEAEDVPTPADAERLFEKVKDRISQYGHVVLVYRRFVNALTYPITAESLFPENMCREDSDILYLPDKSAIAEPLEKLCLTSRLYGVMLQSATGAQAATLMTMRSAADNAKEEAAKTELKLNRERQNALTASVIESASGMIHEEF